MGFLEYLRRYKDITEDAPGMDGRLFRILAIDGSQSYRDAGVRVASLGEVRDRFEELWNDYEDHLDLDRHRAIDPEGWRSIEPCQSQRDNDQERTSNDQGRADDVLGWDGDESDQSGDKGKRTRGHSHNTQAQGFRQVSVDHEMEGREMINNDTSRLTSQPDCGAGSHEYKGRPGDTGLHLVADLGDGFGLWRLCNRAGALYSVIVDPGGSEILSTEIEGEPQMVAHLMENKRVYICQ